jgi:hypothetical protein
MALTILGIFIIAVGTSLFWLWYLERQPKSSFDKGKIEEIKTELSSIKKLIEEQPQRIIIEKEVKPEVIIPTEATTDFGEDETKEPEVSKLQQKITKRRKIAND